MGDISVELPAKTSIGHADLGVVPCKECLKLVIGVDGVFTLFLVLDGFAIIGNIMLTW